MAALPFEGPPALTVRCQAPAYLEEEALLAHLGVPLLGHCNTRGSLVQANLSSLRLRATVWLMPPTNGRTGPQGTCTQVAATQGQESPCLR